MGAWGHGALLLKVMSKLSGSPPAWTLRSARAPGRAVRSAAWSGAFEFGQQIADAIFFSAFFGPPMLGFRASIDKSWYKPTRRPEAEQPQRKLCVLYVKPYTAFTEPQRALHELPQVGGGGGGAGGP